VATEGQGGEAEEKQRKGHWTGEKWEGILVQERIKGGTPEMNHFWKFFEYPIRSIERRHQKIRRVQSLKLGKKLRKFDFQFF
jgi:hypothetical protein